ncbi:hypothetical protein PybrP1_001994 [[Pythium] brassicae (nom. inval.)]|nr:hypothetical protein PybrP1_001994 [[Pythium] brassicae (nom. inval.)]
MEEDAQQRITYLLQEIDANICAAHRSATQICATVRRHHQILRQIHDATQVWKPLFDSFARQPVMRRAPPTPSATFARSAASSPASGRQKRRLENGGSDDDSYGDAYRLDESEDREDDDSFEEEDSLMVGAQQFKTTTLVEHLDRTVNDSFNVSIASDNLPQMTRTSYMPTPTYRDDGHRHDVSSINTEERSNWSPAMSSPIRTGVLKFSNMRRKFSTGSDYLTPTKFREVESRASIEATVARASQNLLVEEEPVTPPLDLASPLLRTQLKAMTPHTPLSNRLVGANLDIGSMSQESKLQDYDDSFNSGEPAPQFEIALFPAAFQRGVGAVQISTLYSKFQGVDHTSLPTFSVDQLAEKLPDYGKEKIEVLLDTLVSRRLLRPFVVEGTMFWQIPG